MKNKIKEMISQEELIKITADLVRIPSHSETPGREAAIANYLYKLFCDEGIDAELQVVKNNTPNVIATLKGTGGGKSFMLNGHVDTVPPLGMDKPFEAEIRDGVLYGRGACDMKAGVASMAYTLILLKRLGVKLRGDLMFCGVIEEDAATSDGSRFVVKNGPHADFGIVGEPTELKVVTAHKGIDYFHIKVNGRAAHSSKSENGANAIYAAAEVISKIETELIPQYNYLVHPLVGPPKVNVGLIQGSASSNKAFLLGNADTFAGTVPDACDIYLDIRWTPHQSVDTIIRDLAELCEKVERDGVTVEVAYIPLPRPAMEVSGDNALVKALCANLEGITGTKEEPSSAGFWTDAGLFYGLLDMPTVVCGPGNIAFAHGPDEQINIDELPKAVMLYAHTAMDICGV